MRAVAESWPLEQVTPNQQSGENTDEDASNAQTGVIIIVPT
jgi:hypothetical protein